MDQIDEAIKSLNLKFIGFELEDQKVLNDFDSLYPNEHSRRSLSLWEKFEKETPPHLETCINSGAKSHKHITHYYQTQTKRLRIDPPSGVACVPSANLSPKVLETSNEIDIACNMFE